MNETMRTQYTGMTTPVDTIKEPDMSIEQWEAMHRSNIMERWLGEPPLINVSPLSFITIEYVSGGENVGDEMVVNPNETLLHYERRFLNIVLPQFWASHIPDANP